MNDARLRRALYALAAILVLLHSGKGLAQQPKAPAPDPSAAASDMASFFSQVGDQIYEDCIFELSQEQIEVQQALVVAYMKYGASNARRPSARGPADRAAQALRQVRADQVGAENGARPACPTSPRPAPSANRCGASPRRRRPTAFSVPAARWPR